MLRHQCERNLRRALRQSQAHRSYYSLTPGVSPSQLVPNCNPCVVWLHVKRCSGFAGTPANRLQHTIAASQLKPDESTAQTNSASWPLYGVLGKPAHEQ